MIPGSYAASLRLHPWNNITSSQPGNTNQTANGSPGWDGTNFLFRDGANSDIMSSTLPDSGYVDQWTTGLDPSGMIRYENGRYFFRQGTAANWVTATTLGGTLTTISLDGRDLRWQAETSAWIMVGDDGLGNGLYATSTNGTTWTTRADIITADRLNHMALGNGRIITVGNSGKISTTTSTTLAHSWSAITSTNNPFGTLDLDYVSFNPGTPDGDVWAIGSSGNGMVVGFSTNGTSFTLKTIFPDTNNRGAHRVFFIPSIGRWVAYCYGGSTQGGKGQITAMSDTNSYTGTWSYSAENTDSTTQFAAQKDIVFVNNTHLLLPGLMAKLWYVRV